VADASENSGALLPTVRKALPFLAAVGAGGGPTGAPSTNAPSGDDTDVTSGTRESAAEYRLRSAGVTPPASGITTVTLVAESTANSLRN
jgi:hypothetical protein